MPNFEKGTDEERITKYWKQNGPFLNIGFLSILKFDEPYLVHSGEFIYGCNMIIHRQTAIEFGGFPPDGMPQDKMCYRGDGETGLFRKLRAKNLDFLYSKKLTLKHKVTNHRLSAGYLKKRSFNQAISDGFTNYKKGNLYFVLFLCKMISI